MISRNKKPKNYIDAREKRSPSDHIAIKYFKRGFTAKAIFIPVMILYFLSLREIVESFVYDNSPEDLIFAYTYFLTVSSILIYLIRSKTAFMDETKENYVYIITVNIIGILMATYLISFSGINHSYILALLFAILMFRISFYCYESRMGIQYFKINNYLVLGIVSMLFLSYLKGLH